MHFSVTTSLLLVLTVACGPTPCLRGPTGRALPKAPLRVGQQMTLRAGALDILKECDLPAAGKVRWSSSDTGVAHVDTDGTITARAVGSTEISVQVGRKRTSHPVVVTQR